MMCDIDGYWYQVGVVAAGLGCGNIEIPGLYTRISYFFDWINGTISGYQG
ncbi:unnamed protein product [Lymnaea stagnalis]|uniref:Peptidase S1 domain-containing protein n=1 Tax=Lymnaea stagnalis TaxID=6523 RepID=A0AAV2H736_LYMST